MKHVLYIIPILLAVTIPNAFAEVEIITGKNYDLIENYFTGEAVWTSHPERIMIDNVWQNYDLINNDEKVIFNSNSIGSFVYDKNTCSYSIYENGFVNPETQIIPSVSAVATHNNGEWSNMDVNDSSCDVIISQYDKGINLTSTKLLNENITTFTFVNGTNNIQNIEKEKFVQIINLDIDRGIKETFYIYDNSNSGNQLGVSQTLHAGSSIIMGTEEIQISEMDGMSFDKDFIIENKAEILQVAQNLNYDMDKALDFLTSVNIIHDESFFNNTYKINLDYSDGSFIGYLEIDPTLSLSGTTKSTYSFNAGGYSSSNTAGYIGSDGAWVYKSGFYWDITSIPDSATITNTVLEYDTGNTSSAGGMNCDINPISGTLSTDSGSTIHSDVSSGTPYVNDSNFCATSNITNGTIDLGINADLEIESKLSADEFGIGVVQDPENYSVLRLQYFPNMDLQVTYTVPTAPNAPTNLSTVTGIPIELDWDATPTSGNGGSIITGYKVFRTLNEFAQVELPNSSGSDSQLTFTDNEFLLHGFPIADTSINNISITATSGASTDGVIGSTSIEDPSLAYTNTNIPDNTDPLSIGAWINLDTTPTNTKLLQFNDVSFNVGETTASITNVVTTGGDHIDDNFASSPNGWTQVGSSLTITGGKATMSSGAGSTDNALRKALGTTLGDEFIIDFDLSGLSASASTTYWKTFGLCDSSTSFSSIPSTDDCFWALSRNTGGTEFQWKDDGTSGYSGNTGLGWDFSEPNGFNRLSFDGTSVTYSTYPDATRTGTPSNTGTFTIPATLGGFTHFTIGGYDGNEPSFRNVSWTIDNLFVTDLAQTTQNVLSVTGLTSNTATEQHYIFQRDGNDFEIFQNGVSKGTATSTVNFGSNSGKDYSTVLDGTLDEFFINSDVLTSTEINDIYERGLTPTLITTTIPSVTEYDDSTAVSGNNYFYSVKSTNALGDSDFLTPFVSGLAGTPPGAPTGLTSTIQDADNAPLDVFLQWSSPVSWGSGTAQGFEIYRDGILITTTTLQNSYTDTVTQGSHTHYVKAVSSHGTSGNSNTANITTPNAPDAITDLSGSATSDTQINLSYSAPNDNGSNIDLYKIFKDGVQVDTTTNSSYSLTGLTSNTAYAITVYANNSVGDSLVSNTENITTYQSVSGSITVTPNTQGASTQLTFSTSGVSGTPTPTFNTFTLKEGITVIASGVSSPYTLTLNDDSAHTYTITSTDNTHWDTPTISGNTIVTASYDPTWKNGIAYNYTRGSGVMDLTVNKDSQTLWDATCNYKTTTEVLNDQSGIQSNHTGVWYISESQSISDIDTVYVSCNDDGDTLFSFTSFGPNRLGGGIAQLDDTFEGMIGTPVALIFVLLVAGLFTGRSAPTGILLVLALVGVLGFIGMLTIDEAVWGFLLLAGVLGIFLGKRFL